jgi:hypothetical protein
VRTVPLLLLLMRAKHTPKSGEAIHGALRRPESYENCWVFTL